MVCWIYIHMILLIFFALFGPWGTQGCNFLFPFCSVLRQTSDLIPASPSFTSSFPLHCSSPGCLWTTYSAFFLWLPSHCHHTIIISRFPEYMADPIPASSSEFIAYLVDPRNLFNFLIAYFLQPSYYEDPSEACELEAVHLVFLCLCYFPCFTTIEQHWAYKCDIQRGDF